MIAAFEDNDEAILNAMAALEFGVVDSERRSPYMAMAASGLLFVVGAMTSILPFVFFDETQPALILATILTGSRVVRRREWSRPMWPRPLGSSPGFENLVVAGVGGVIAWGHRPVCSTPTSPEKTVL